MKLSRVRFIISFCSLFMMFISCAEKKETKEQTTIKDWSLEGFVHPESIIFSEDSSFLYVSNIGLDESDSTPDGFISKVSLEGKIIELKWVDSIQSPKGQVLANGKYYVSALDELLEIDTKNGKIVNRYTHDSIVFLNDVCSDKKGNIYVTGMKENAIYCLGNKRKLERIYQNDSLLHPNGVFEDKGILYIGTWGEKFEGDFKGYFKRLDLKSKEITNITKEKLGRLDGIQKQGNDFLVSSWAEGKIYKISNKGELKLVLQADESLGDFLFDQKNNCFYLPQNFQNKILSVCLK